MADARNLDYTNFVTLNESGHDALIQEKYTTLELFNAARRFRAREHEKND